MLTFAIHGYEGVDPAIEFGPLQAEFQRRGVPCLIVRSARTRTKTPNQDRARVMIAALREIAGDIALLGISNQGLFMPLVAAARPIKRIVFINAAIPRPGKSFWRTARKERAFASLPAWWLAWVAPGMHEVYPLDDLPKVEYVYVAAEDDEAIRPEWEQRAAREYLHVEPVVVAGAGHSDIVLRHVSEVVDAALLQSQRQPAEARGRRLRRRKRNFGLSIVISHFVPLIAYFVVRPHAASDTQALAIAWFIPLAWTLGSSTWFRRLDVLGLLGITFYGVALFVSVHFGMGALPLKLQHAAVGVVIGLACLISVAIGRPALVLLARLVLKSTGGDAPAAALAVADPRSKAAGALRFMTLVVGIACLANAALQTALALTLSTAGFLIARVAVHVLTMISFVAGGLLYLRFRRS
jgi:hypothetical protein